MHFLKCEHAIELIFNTDATNIQNTKKHAKWACVFKKWEAANIRWCKIATVVLANFRTHPLLIITNDKNISELVCTITAHIWDYDLEKDVINGDVAESDMEEVTLSQENQADNQGGNSLDGELELVEYQITEMRNKNKQTN